MNHIGLLLENLAFSWYYVGCRAGGFLCEKFCMPAHKRRCRMKISTKGRYALRMMIDFGGASGRGFRFTERYCGTAGNFQKISGADYSDSEPFEFPAGKPRCTGRLSACKSTECLYGKRYPGTDGGQPCTCCVSGYNARGLRAQRVLRDTATMERPS